MTTEEEVEAVSKLKPGQKIRIEAQVTVGYEVEYYPDAYMGAKDEHDVANIEHSLINDDGDYFIAMMGLEGTTFDIDSVEAS